MWGSAKTVSHNSYSQATEGLSLSLSCDHNAAPYFPCHSPSFADTDMSKHVVEPYSELEDFTTTKSEAFMERLDHFSQNREEDVELVGSGSHQEKRSRQANLSRGHWAVSYCGFCHSAITVGCAKLEQREILARRSHKIALKAIREGAVAGCQDCELILTAIELCYPGKDGTAHLQLEEIQPNTWNIKGMRLGLKLSLRRNLEGSSIASDDKVELFRINSKLDYFIL
jgi:hypothetical protein